MIFNIQKCSIHDGSGLRTLVFFKGCPLRCKWCANPESQLYVKEVMESPSKCIGCGACIEECPEGAIVLTQDEGPIIQRDKCARCFNCTEVCYAGAKYEMGREITTDELFHEIQKDKIFYKMHGGGVTFSGGEPLTHPNDLTAIAKKCQENGISVMLESCGVGKYENFSKALPYVSGMFMDIKHIDPKVHKELTGSDNVDILENIRKIADYGIPIVARTPIIPGLNDSEDNIRGIAEFIASVPGITEYELLPYHEFGVNKYKALGREYPLRGLETPSEEKMDGLMKVANSVLASVNKECFVTRNNNRVVVK